MCFTNTYMVGNLPVFFISIHCIIFRNMKQLLTPFLFALLAALGNAIFVFGQKKITAGEQPILISGLCRCIMCDTIGHSFISVSVGWAHKLYKQQLTGNNLFRRRFVYYIPRVLSSLLPIWRFVLHYLRSHFHSNYIHSGGRDHIQGNVQYILCTFGRLRNSDDSIILYWSAAVAWLQHSFYI